VDLAGAAVAPGAAETSAAAAEEGLSHTNLTSMNSHQHQGAYVNEEYEILPMDTVPNEGDDCEGDDWEGADVIMMMLEDGSTAQSVAAAAAAVASAGGAGVAFVDNEDKTMDTVPYD
jgi:hypothetical protein